MRTNSIAPGAAYLHNQEAVLARLTDKYAKERKVQTDKLGEPVIWAKNTTDALMLVKSFMMDDVMKIDFLSDVTAYDNCDSEDGDARFVMVYQLYSIDNHIRVRIKFLVQENEEVQTLTGTFPAANWLEREIFDLYGIRFKGHPNLRRIMMDERFEGHPLRKDYRMKHRQPFSDNIRLHLGGHPLYVDTQLDPGKEK